LAVVSRLPGGEIGSLRCGRPRAKGRAPAWWKGGTVRVAPLVVLAIVLVASTGRAVSIWDGARDPRAAHVSRVLIEAERARQPREFSLDTLASLPLFDGQLAMHAALILEEAGGEALGDPDVDYFLGDCLVAENRGRDEEGRRILLRALAAAPASPR